MTNTLTIDAITIGWPHALDDLDVGELTALSSELDRVAAPRPPHDFRMASNMCVASQGQIRTLNTHRCGSKTVSTQVTAAPAMRESGFIVSGDARAAPARMASARGYCAVDRDQDRASRPCQPQGKRMLKPTMQTPAAHTTKLAAL
jgi:hypothetical protein